MTDNEAIDLLGWAVASTQAFNTEKLYTHDVAPRCFLAQEALDYVRARLAEGAMEPRTVMLNFRATEEEAAAFKAAASRRGVPLSAWLREIAQKEARERGTVERAP